MDILYRNYEEPTYKLKFGGYFTPFYNYYDFNCQYFIENNYVHTNDISDYIIKPEFNAPYFDEANILSKINYNNDGYFDFNKAILDIGACVGVYSFRSNFKYVYAFEPNKEMFTFLNFNIMLFNKLHNSQTYNVLLSDKCENIEFDGFTCNQDYITDIFKKSSKSIIKSHTLDEFNCENVGLIKVDVEGMEEKVLRGGIGTIIRNNYPPILFELWTEGDESFNKHRESLINFISNDLGYDILWQYGNIQTHLALHK